MNTCRPVTTRCPLAATLAAAVCADVPVALQVKYARTGGRIGTYHATDAELVAALGQGAYGCDDKTTREFYFVTPYGNVAMWDYWMSAHDEWTLAAEDERAAMCLAATLDRLLDRPAAPYLADTAEALRTRIACTFARAA